MGVLCDGQLCPSKRMVCPTPEMELKTETKDKTAFAHCWLNKPRSLLPFTHGHHVRGTRCQSHIYCPALLSSASVPTPALCTSILRTKRQMEALLSPPAQSSVSTQTSSSRQQYRNRYGQIEGGILFSSACSSRQFALPHWRRTRWIKAMDTLKQDLLCSCIYWNNISNIFI